MRYQAFPNFDMTCGACAQNATAIWCFWAFPYHKGCNCRQHLIKPGELSLPFVYFLDEINNLDLEQQHALLGRGNWALFKSGLVKWSELVTRYGVKEFALVVEWKGLTIPEMLRAGVSEEDAKLAWESSHTPEKEAIRAQRAEALQRLRAHGLTDEEIAREVAVRLFGRAFPPSKRSGNHEG